MFKKSGYCKAMSLTVRKKHQPTGKKEQSMHKKQLNVDEKAIKQRRKVSDARWRANLAQCYDTLKKTIPLSDSLFDKQKHVSKVGFSLLLF